MKIITSSNSKHGGSRKGAGKPALYGQAMKRVNVMLDSETIEFYTKQGNGNLSEGIRNHWRGLTPLAADLGEAPAKKRVSKSRSNPVIKGEQKPAPSG